MQRGGLENVSSQARSVRAGFRRGTRGVRRAICRHRSRSDGQRRDRATRRSRAHDTHRDAEWPHDVPHVRPDPVAEMEALATTYPDMVAVKTSPHKSIEGRHDQVHRDHQQRERQGRQARLLRRGRDPRQRDPGGRGQPRVRLRRALARRADQPKGELTVRQGPLHQHAGRQRRRSTCAIAARTAPARSCPPSTCCFLPPAST